MILGPCPCRGCHVFVWWARIPVSFYGEPWGVRRAWVEASGDEHRC